jgi:ribonuclease P protein component
LERRFRLTKTADFQRVRRLGKSYAHPLLVLVILPGDAGSLRIGVVAGRYTGNAVKRNRVKRQLRAAIFILQKQMALGWDMIFIARKPIGDASFEKIQDAVKTLLLRARVLEKDVA